MNCSARENHHKKSVKPKIYFFDQPPAGSVSELLTNIDGGSVYQYLVVALGNVRWNWNLLVVRLDGIDGWADVWSCHFKCDNTNPSIGLSVTRQQIPETVRYLFRFSASCREKLPVGHRHLISPKAVDALLAAKALAEAIRR